MIILKIIGVLLLIILTLLVVAICIPVCICVTYDGGTAIVVKYLFWRYSKQLNGDETLSQVDKENKEPTIFNRIFSKISGGFKKLRVIIKRTVHKLSVSLKNTLGRNAKSKSRKRKKAQKSGNAKKSKTKSTEQSLLASLREQRGFWGAIGFFVDLGKLFGGKLLGIYRGVAANKFILRAEIVGEDAADTAVKYGKICTWAFPALSYLLGNMRRYNQDIEITPNFNGDEGKIYFEGEFVVFPASVIWHGLCGLARFTIDQIKFEFKNRKAD